MDIRLFIAILVGKIIQKVTQTLKIGGGSAAPGYYALKIYPNLVADLGKQVPQTIIVTGTNGKTTTARMLAQFAKNFGLKVLRNSTGSNLERGIASTLISNFQLRNRKLKPTDLAIWELDEAAFNIVAPKLFPNVVIFLNVLRDQLDRYGEVDSVIKKWQQTLKQLDIKTLVILNGDDHNLLDLQKYCPGKIKTFGVKDNKIHGEKIIYQNKQQKLDLEAKNIQTQELDKVNFTAGSQSFSLPVPGIYHVYNFLAAYLCAQYLKIPASTIRQTLKDFSPAFGRVEKFDWGYIFLIKNPAGTTQVLQTLAPQLKKDDYLLLALNDNLADGTDVSWIWDAEFEELKVQGSPKSHCLPLAKWKIICSGKRAEDMALRLKYAGFDLKSIVIETNLKKALKQARKDLKGRLFILPTYTALLELQQILASAGIKKHYWKEEE